MRILSHNVFWFQGVPFATDRPGDADERIVRALASLYRALDPDVVCFQEIQDHGAFTAARDTLAMTGCYTPGATHRQYGGAMCWRGDRWLGDVFDDGNPFAVQRFWQMIEVRGNAGDSLRICNIHLPSSRQLGREMAGGPARGRGREHHHAPRLSSPHRRRFQ